MDGYVIFFLDSDMKISGVCDDYISLRFTEEFSAEGEFECVLRTATKVPEVDSLVMCGGFVYAVEQLSLDTARGEVCVRGRGILSLLGRRSIPYTLPLRRNVERIVNYLVRNFASDVLSAPLEVGEIGAETDANVVVEAGNLLVRLKLLAASVMKGLRLRYNTAQGKFTFELYDRRDRRIANTDGNEPFLLSEGFGTLGALVALTDKSGYINRVNVRASAGGNDVYSLVTVDAASYDFPDGYDDSAEEIREGYVRSGIGVSFYTSEDEDGNEVFDSDGYYAAIREYGRQYLSGHRVRRELKAQLVDAQSVDVGDVCSLNSPAADVSAVLITAKEYSYKNGKLSCSVNMTAIG